MVYTWALKGFLYCILFLGVYDRYYIDAWTLWPACSIRLMQVVCRVGAKSV